MVKGSRNPTNQSLFFTQENFGILRVIINLILGASLAALASCKALPKPEQKLATKEDLALPGARLLTADGENESPQFSDDGEKIMFISRSRPFHKNSQIYEMDLKKKNERRITFQDGEVRNPRYVGAEQIIYSSTTDEIKENLTYVGQLGNSEAEKHSSRPPTEIYLSDPFGNNIERLTEYPGYDDEAQYIQEKNPYVLFTSYRGGLLGIFKFDLKTNRDSFFLVDKEVERWNLIVSKDQKKVVWLEKKASMAPAILLGSLHSPKSKILKQDGREYRDLSFVSKTSQVVYSVRKNKDEAFHIEVFDTEKNCTQKVFSHADSLVQPTWFAGPPTQVAFTRLFKTSMQVYLAELSSDLGPCLESQP